MINVPNLAQSPLLNKNLNNKTQSPVQNQKAQKTPKTTHTSWLYINDVHGKMTNMERIYNITREFDKIPAYVYSANFFTKPNAQTNPQVSKFKVASGDIIFE